MKAFELILLSGVLAITIPDCVVTPSIPECASFDYLGASADVKSLCMMMGQMPGCSIYNICKTRPSSSKIQACDPMSILADICVSDTMSGMPGCKSYNSLCREGSVVSKCKSSLPVPSIPTTREAKTFASNLCENPSNCGTCDLVNAPSKCDLLSLYSKLCIAKPDNENCKKWKNMCSVSEDLGGVSEWPELCPRSFFQQTEIAFQQTVDCIHDPTQMTCVDFIYTGARQDVTDNCLAMPNMPGCSIKNICDKDSLKSSSVICNPMSILNDICIKDMAMDECSTYMKICATPGTVVQQCSDMQSIPFIPSYDQALTNIKSICSSHFMNGCQTCNLENPADCDLLLLYSQLCKSMPYMSQCSNWKSMCSSSSPFSVSSWNELCPSSDRISSDPPIMRMYFHTGIIDYVLFETWVPRSTASYIFTLLFIVMLGIIYEGIRTIRSWCEKAWFDIATAIRKPAQKTGCCSSKEVDENSSLLQRPYSPCCAGNPPSSIQVEHATPRDSFWTYFRISIFSQKQEFNFKAELIRSFLQMIEMTIAYALMLIAMSFNLGMFIAVIIGVGIGTFLFARFRTFNPTCGCC